MSLSRDTELYYVRLRTEGVSQYLPSTVLPLEKLSARILTPLSGGPRISCEVGHANTLQQGGMKGYMVPGDAHPYLVPYKES